MTIKKLMPITASKCADLIKKRFKMDDIIIVYSSNPKSPYDVGCELDTAGYIIKTLNDHETFDKDKKYNFVVGLVKLNTNNEYL